MRSSFVVMIMLFLTASAEAQSPSPTPEQKSPLGSLALSAGGTAVGLGLSAIVLTQRSDWGGREAVELGASFFIMLGPSFGHLYVGNGTATLGLYVRGAGLALGLIGGASSITGCEDKGDAGPFAPCRRLMDFGIGVILLGAVVDIAAAPGAANDWNRRHDLTLAPIVMPTTNGTAPGLAVGGTF